MAKGKTVGIRCCVSVWAVCFVLFSCLPVPVLAQAGNTRVNPVSKNSATPDRESEIALFTDDALLHFKLVVDYQQLLKDRGEERSYHQAVLHYTDKAGAAVSMNLKVMVRGNRRRDPAVCRFPPLLLNFPRKKTVNTVFEGTNKLKMVTHCIGDDYVLREYLVYKLYSTLTEESYRVRLCQVAYEDLRGKRKPELRYAFLLEDDDDVARRCKGKIMPEKLLIRMDRAEPRAMARVAFFQYMIGNTDWSVPFRHNIDLLSRDSLAAPVPIPYDFDYAGIVDAPYAVPPPELGITSVKQRLFRGYTFEDSVYAEVKALFNRYRGAMYGVYLHNELLDKRYQKQTLKYLDNFFETLNDPKDFEKKIVRAGQQNQKSIVVIKGLK